MLRILALLGAVSLAGLGGAALLDGLAKTEALALGAPPPTRAGIAEDEPDPAARFREQVLRELGPRASQAPRADGRGPSQASRTQETPEVARRQASAPPGSRPPRRAEIEGPARRAEIEGSARRADWEYLEDVFAGRVSGIPNERKAGISLQEMARLGPVPHVDALREQGDLEALRDLGFEPAVVSWHDSGGRAPLDDERRRVRRYPLNPRLEHTAR